MISTLTVHAGSHKTGTSSIQRFLRANKADLIERENIAFFDIKKILKPTPDLLDYDFRRNAFSSLKDNDYRQAILSKENFSWIDTKERLFELRSALSDFAMNIEVIFYLRRQDSLAVSQKQEGIKWADCAIAYGHETRALPSELSGVAFNYLDFHRKIRMWADVFGDDKINIRIFEREKLIRGDAVHDFCALLGIDSNKYKIPASVNSSFSRTTQLFLHQTRNQFREDTPEKKRLVDIVWRIDRELNEGRKLMPSRQEAEDLYALFYEGNRKLATEFEVNNEAALFNEDFSMYPETEDHDGLTQDEMNNMFLRVFNKLLDDEKSIRQAGAIVQQEASASLGKPADSDSLFSKLTGLLK